MSHAVTVTRTTTTSSATAIVLNTGFLKTVPGILKIFETILGAICLGLVINYNKFSSSYDSGFAGDSDNTIFLLVSFGFLITTFLLVLASLMSLMAATMLPKTIFEFLYHTFAFIFYISASVAMFVSVSRTGRYYSRDQEYNGKMAAACIGLINSILYFLSTLFSFRSNKAG